MKQFAFIVIIIVLLGCVSNGALSALDEEKTRKYSATAISLSDFSMTIMGYYGTQNLSVSKDFDTKQFFDVLEKTYPDQSRVKHVQESYKVSVRALDGGYSVMLCDPQTNQKIMEDLSCHLDRVEIRSWQSNVDSLCFFESNWKQYCE